MPNINCMIRYEAEIRAKGWRIDISPTFPISLKDDNVYKLCLWAIEEPSCLILRNQRLLKLR